MLDMQTSYAPEGDVTTTTRGGLSPQATRLLALYRRLAGRQATDELGPAAAPRAAPAPGPQPTGEHERYDPRAEMLKNIELQDAMGAPIYTDQSGGVFTNMEVRAGAGPFAAASGRYRRDQKIPGGNVY